MFAICLIAASLVSARLRSLVHRWLEHVLTGCPLDMIVELDRRSVLSSLDCLTSLVHGHATFSALQRVQIVQAIMCLLQQRR